LDTGHRTPASHAYYVADGNGNITALVSTNGVTLAHYQYDPFGNVLAMSGSLAEANLYRFSSKEIHNQSTLVYYLYRYYHPGFQRWTTRDPSLESGSCNIYQFVNNRPVNYVDPLGLTAYPSDFIGPLQEGDYRCPPSPQGHGIFQNMGEALHVAGELGTSLLWFYDKVQPGGSWDFKAGKWPNASQYEDFGNFNYGATGNTLDINDWQLQNMAGIVQQRGPNKALGEGTPGNPLKYGSGTPPYGDEPKDNEWIRRGIQYSKDYPVEKGPGPCK
jgi:RHS repeat-associated protein